MHKESIESTVPSSDFLPSGWILCGGLYIIVRVLAAGTFGVTYLASDSEGCHVAIKECMPRSLAIRGKGYSILPKGDKYASDFGVAKAQQRQEAITLESVIHPRVVSILHSFEELNTVYLVMNLIAGRKLADVVNAVPGGLPPEFLEPVARSLLSTLTFLHSSGLVHRDINPSNVLIDVIGNPMLIDFGTSRFIQNSIKVNEYSFRLVCHGYSPPEQYCKDSAVDPRSDLYSLGATLYFAITGDSPPFAEDRLAAIRVGQQDLLNRLIMKESAYGFEFLSLVRQALSLSPEARPDSASSWLHKLSQNLSNPGV